MKIRQRLRLWLLLPREEINRLEREGIRNARTFSEMTAAMAWAETHRKHPWRGFFMDILGSIAMMGAAMVSMPRLPGR